MIAATWGVPALAGALSTNTAIHHLRVNPPGVEVSVGRDGSDKQIVSDASGNLYVVFAGLQRGRKDLEIFFWRSTEAEAEPAVNLSEAASHDRGPQLVVTSEGEVHCVWLKDDPVNYARGEARKSVKRQIGYRRSVDQGASWGPTRVWDVGYSSARLLSLQRSPDGTLFLVTSNFALEGEAEEVLIWVSRDDGEQWERSRPGFAKPQGSASAPQLTFGSAGEAFLVWLDETPGGRAVVFSHSLNQGRFWSDPQVLNSDVRRLLQQPSLCVQGEDIRVFWSDVGRDGGQIWSNHSTNSGKSWGGDRVVYQAPVTAITSKCHWIQDNLVLYWQDSRDRIREKGMRLLFQVFASGSLEPALEAPLALNGEILNARSYSGFDLHELSAGVVSVYAERNLQQRLTVLAGISRDLKAGFDRPQAISEQEPGSEVLFPQAAAQGQSRLAVIYNRRRSKINPVQPVARFGDLLLSTIEVEGFFR